MAIKNIRRILCFAKSIQNGVPGPVLSLPELESKYGFEPDGTNFYYGINDKNVQRVEQGDDALNATHKTFFQNMLAALDESAAPEKMVVLGVEPPQQSQPFAYVAQHLGLVRKLARELHELQQQPAPAKRLLIRIRYASEMNDGKLKDPANHNKYAGLPEEYKASFREVRKVFREDAPDIRFAFSPAIRFDLKESALTAYWPGDEHVDVIAGTWYIGAPTQQAASTDFFRDYVLHRQGKGKPFGVDELGGCETFGDNEGRKVDACVERMLKVITDLGPQNIEFEYVTLFLERKWGTGATLAFVKEALPPIA